MPHSGIMKRYAGVRSDLRLLPQTGRLVSSLSVWVQRTGDYERRRPGAPWSTRQRDVAADRDPLPAGLLALAVASILLAALELGWIPPTEGHAVAFGLLLLVVSLQFVGSVVAYLARDPVASTALGVLAGTWAAVALSKLTSPPGATSAGLGVLLVGACVLLWVPALVGLPDKVLPCIVFVLAGLRFLLTGIYQLTSAPAWETVTGIVGLVVCACALYCAFAALYQDARGQRGVPPLMRRGGARTSEAAAFGVDAEHVASEPGVRGQL
ncbi:GPR1/FUN34/yaaH family protein [Actinopolymorpha singaporensis]|uniref:GPR1/FUN34/yaaH family protein n=2 Tax=Actinopolymorpha singaporensis TaxID=117157 RepID=A0A1H1TLI6_9ACTN|nr:GPR1/FUN34/yaaH family protein [Actinopolymorpha singaporensis]